MGRRNRFFGRFLLPVVVLLFLVGSGGAPARAGVTVETVNGRAVLEGSADRVRGQAVNSALRQALRRYVFEEQGIDSKFEKKVNEKILAQRNRFVQSYEILHERILGDLYQVELRVELRADLLDQALAGIERKHKQRVERLILAQLPPVQIEGEVPAAPVLEPSLLLADLQSELRAYGFSLEPAGLLSSDLKVMLSRVLAAPSSESGGRRLEASIFKGLLPGDLVFVVRSSPAIEEKIASLGKSFWKGRAEIAMIDIRNGHIVRLPPVTAKIIGDDYVTGLKALTQVLGDRVREAFLDRLLRDYVVSEQQAVAVVLECRDFRRPADFELFRQRLEALRSVSRVRIQALSAGLIELRLQLVTPPETLINWINSFQAPEFSGRLTAYAIGNQGVAGKVVRVDCDARLPGD